MEISGLDIEWVAHDCFRVKGNKTVYFDPFRVFQADKADLILITHEHFDHLSLKDIEKVITPETEIVASRLCQGELTKLKGRVKRIILVKPESKVEIQGIKIETIRAYNTNKFKSAGEVFHPKEEDRIGFVVTINGKKIYHAGDTDFIPEMRSLKNIDIALLPISGTYVMTPEEAIQAVNAIKPKAAIPMHYGSIVGSLGDADRFKALVRNTQVFVFEK